MSWASSVPARCVSPRHSPQPHFRQTMAYKNEYTYVQEALTLLKAISEREAKRHQMDQDLTPSMLALLEDEIIPMIENELDADYAPDEVGEPPITMAEMHAAAWKEHQAMHS